MLTERWNGRGREAAGLAASSGGGEERGSWPGLLRRSSGRRGCRIRLAAFAGEKNKGQRGPRFHGGEQNRASVTTHRR